MLPPILVAVAALVPTPGTPPSSAQLSRRAILAAPAALILASSPRAATAAGKDPYACRGDASCGMDRSAIQRFTSKNAKGDAVGVRIGGSYSDPNHPGCPRKVTLSGSTAIITGADGNPGCLDGVIGEPWKVKGSVSGRDVVIDFSPKGGPKDIAARWNGLGLEFGDGNVWTKK